MSGRRRATTRTQCHDATIWTAIIVAAVGTGLTETANARGGTGGSGAPPEVRHQHRSVVVWRWFLSIGDPLPPPPSLQPYLPQFIPLCLSYQSLSADASKPPFSQWLIMRGVVHPTTHRAMMLLFEWAERNSL